MNGLNFVRLRSQGAKVINAEEDVSKEKDGKLMRI